MCCTILRGFAQFREVNICNAAGIDLGFLKGDVKLGASIVGAKTVATV